MSEKILLSTTHEIPGRITTAHLGLVAGAGGKSTGTSSTEMAREALRGAITQMRETANELGADAIVGVMITATSSGGTNNRPHTVLTSGTAVKLKVES
jgi:uncharacterized protein YbjQ (UPF0145 family)